MPSWIFTRTSASSKKTKNSHSMSCCLFNWKIFRGSQSGGRNVLAGKSLSSQARSCSSSPGSFSDAVRSEFVMTFPSVARSIPPESRAKVFESQTQSAHRREPSSRTSSIRDRCLVAGWHDDNVGKCRVLCRVLMIMTWHRELLLIHIFFDKGPPTTRPAPGYEFEHGIQTTAGSSKRLSCPTETCCSPSQWMGGFYQVRK